MCIYMYASQTHRYLLPLTVKARVTGIHIHTQKNTTMLLSYASISAHTAHILNSAEKSLGNPQQLHATSRGHNYASGPCHLTLCSSVFRNPSFAVSVLVLECHKKHFLKSASTACL